jgi:hypothetical protein|tara:strand:- start:225 stop:488 length:264 start_codon:yes stop_codon:yes gene_type:complete
MSSFTSPLDLKTIFVNYFSGSMEIFMFLFMILLAGLAAKYRMPNYVFLMMLMVFAVFMAGTGYMLFLILAVIITGLIAYWILAKFGK